MEDMYIEGYAIVWDSPTVLYEYDGVSYLEKISSKSLDGADISNVSLKYNHSDQVMIVAATRNGSLQLINDTKGLKIRAKLSNTTAGRDLYELIKTKLISVMSFAFITEKDSYDTKTRTRTVEKIKLLADVSAVDLAAYPQTSIYVMNESQKSEYKARELEIAKLNFRRMTLKDDLDFKKTEVLSIADKETELKKAKLRYEIQKVLDR